MIKANFLEILSNKTLFIFDFDGVLAESVNIKTEAFRSMYTQYGEEIAERVVRAEGTCGSCCDYVQNTVKSLHLLGLRDPALEQLLTLIEYPQNFVNSK